MMMKAASLVTLALAGLVHSAVAKEVVVFVHGLAGFGDDELGPINYWVEIDEFPRDRFDVFVASVGPVSSNWDRACELYAQIKGTQVDYGPSHSSTYSHERYGRDYSGIGFYPQWSTSNRIHLIGHSMGGQTIRQLEVMLQEGVPAEVTAGSSSPLFAGLGNMIKSVTTISTPHDGTPLVDILGEDFVELIKDFILAFAGISDNTFIELIYDLDLDHFGLGRNENESFGDYIERVCAAAVFELGFQDLAPYDLSITGSQALQQQGQQAYADTFYFGMATEQTIQNIPKCEWGYGCGLVSEAESTMGLLLQPFANLIGSLRSPYSLRKNDGLVPFESSKCPKIGYSNGANGCTEFTGTWTPGRWYWAEVDRDHLQVIGFTFLYALTNDAIYSKHADRIWAISSGNAYVGSYEVGDGSDETAPPAPSTDGGLIALAGVVGACIALAGVAGVYAVRRRRMRHTATAGSPKDIQVAASRNPMYDV